MPNGSCRIYTYIIDKHCAAVGMQHRNIVCIFIDGNVGIRTVKDTVHHRSPAATRILNMDQHITGFPRIQPPILSIINNYLKEFYNRCICDIIEGAFPCLQQACDTGLYLKSMIIGDIRGNLKTECIFKEYSLSYIQVAYIFIVIQNGDIGVIRADGHAGIGDGVDFEISKLDTKVSNFTIFDYLITTGRYWIHDLDSQCWEE